MDVRAGNPASTDRGQRDGSGGSLEPPGPLLTHVHTVYTAYSEHLPTRVNPLAERTSFSQVLTDAFDVEDDSRRGRNDRTGDHHLHVLGVQGLETRPAQ